MVRLNNVCEGNNTLREIFSLNNMVERTSIVLHSGASVFLQHCLSWLKDNEGRYFIAVDT